LLREWVDDAQSTADDLDAIAEPDEDMWDEERWQFLMYD
jgi:hypothetical protein